MAGVDYIKEETTDDIYLNEMNTACGVYGSYNEQTASFNLIQTTQMKKGCLGHMFMDKTIYKKVQILHHFNNH